VTTVIENRPAARATSATPLSQRAKCADGQTGHQEQVTWPPKELHWPSAQDGREVRGDANGTWAGPKTEKSAGAGVPGQVTTSRQPAAHRSNSPLSGLRAGFQVAVPWFCHVQTLVQSQLQIGPPSAVMLLSFARPLPTCGQSCIIRLDIAIGVPLTLHLLAVSDRLCASQ